MCSCGKEAAEREAGAGLNLLLPRTPNAPASYSKGEEYMLIFQRKKNTSKEITVIPLIDVVFIMVIFFMLAGTVTPADPVPIDVPKAQAGNAQNTSPLTIYLTKNGGITINSLTVRKQELIKVLIPLLKNDKEQPILVKSDSTAEGSILLDIMTALQRAGGKNIALATQSPL